MTRAFKVGISAPSIIKDGGTSTQFLMADGSVTTGGTTTSMNYAQTQAAKQTAISTSGVTIVSTSITTGGNPVQVLVTGDGENSTAGGWVKLQLFRGTTAIGKAIHLESSAASENIPYALTVIDTPAAGTYTYSLQTVSAVATGTFSFGETDGPVLTAIELNTLLPSTNLSLTGTVTANQIAATNNGNGTNFKVGDDVWIGDINVANTMSIKGQGAPTSGYIRFGSDTNAFGYDGTNLVYGTTIIPSAKTLLVSTDIGSSVQAYDADLAAIAALATGTGFLKNTAGTWSLDTSSYVTAGANSNITSLSGLTTALSVSQGGTGTGTAGITAFNNITGLSAVGTTGTTTTNLVFSTSPTIITPTIASIAGVTTINNAAAGDSINVFANLTTGIAYYGANITTGTLQFANGVSFNGTVSIASGAGTINKAINIGTSSTSGTTTVNIGSSSGATSTVNINGTGIVSGNLTVNGVTVGKGLNSIATNTALGVNALSTNTSGSNNTAIGNASLYINTSGYNNVALGSLAVGSNTGGISNIGIGTFALRLSTSGAATFTIISGGTGYTNGTYTGVQLTYVSGKSTTYVPTVTIVVSGGSVTSITTTTDPGRQLDTSTIFTASGIGPGSGFSAQVATLTSASNNTAIGDSAGYYNLYGSGNVFLGYNAGASETGSNKLYISNIDTPTPLIKGDFSASTVNINGSLTSNSFIKSGGTSSQYLMADGSVNSNISTDITPLDDISNYFDGSSYRFIPRYQGQTVTISNPFRLLLTINGIIQTVRSAEYVWQSMIAQNGVRVDNDGYIVFPEAVPAGSQFDARLMAGSTTTSVTTTYPFRAVDIVLGG